MINNQQANNLALHVRQNLISKNILFKKDIKIGMWLKIDTPNIKFYKIESINKVAKAKLEFNNGYAFAKLEKINPKKFMPNLKSKTFLLKVALPQVSEDGFYAIGKLPIVAHVQTKKDIFLAEINYNGAFLIHIKDKL